ncbi:pyroglutamyl-peptidase I [Alloscardovia theropitheci]|uniref:Pyrrolidone-carboxylate peptidase n=1 Tax=Alloscardovia theropitheci TaxID=2496842 RepID=A0A4R0QYW5_9BIFI|nr:pyroglutamyl-peptidase I [Alloscardovia theropitheci]TCD53726.1 pyroglutamyl-peptidase I [Alloscardovia theropitheci]
MDNYRVVICGFDQYEGVEKNPSRLVTEIITDEGIAFEGASVSVTSVLLPLSFAHAWPTLQQTLDAVEPHVILATGLKTHARTIALERCATNIIDASRPDIDDVQPKDIRINENGPAAYWTGLPLRDISKVLAKNDIPVTFSSDAGTFVCNSIFYELLEWTSHHKDTYAGFVSFPHVEKAVGYTKGMKLDIMVNAAREIITATLEYRKNNL